VAVAALLAACGGESSDANQAAGTYDVRVTDASFPAEQRLGQTSLLQLGVRNTGKKALPALTVTISIAGKEGQQSSLPFGVSNTQTGLAQPDRPVWVLAAGYPKLAGSEEPGGGTTSNRKTFSFGPLKPGATTEAVWKLSAVKAGKFTVVYKIDAGLSGTAKAQTNGVAAGGSFATEISAVPPDTEVADDGEVVEKATQRQRSQPGE
jgi:hypothetical protein